MARLLATSALLALASSALASSSELVLDGGDDGFSKSYYKSVDGVMGGKSSISISYGANSMTATGNLRTDGGGFAGCWRDIAEPVDVSSYAGIAVTYEALAASATPLALELRLSGEGDTGGSWLDHRAVFALSPSADADGVGVATLPFDAFVPRYRGSERTGSLDLAAVDEIGLQLLFQAGEFEFTILKIAAVDELNREDPPPALGDSPSPEAVVDAIDAAVERGSYRRPNERSAFRLNNQTLSLLVGSYVFNKGYMSQCDHVYAATARGLAASLEGGAGLREDARAALAAAVEAAEAMGFTQQDEIDRAWALRYGLNDARAAAVEAGDAWPADAGAAVAATTTTAAVAEATKAPTPRPTLVPTPRPTAKPKKKSCEDKRKKAKKQWKKWKNKAC